MTPAESTRNTFHHTEKAISAFLFQCKMKKRTIQLEIQSPLQYINTKFIFLKKCNTRYFLYPKGLYAIYVLPENIKSYPGKFIFLFSFLLFHMKNDFLLSSKIAPVTNQIKFHYFSPFHYYTRAKNENIEVISRSKYKYIKFKDI